MKTFIGTGAILILLSTTAASVGWREGHISGYVAGYHNGLSEQIELLMPVRYKPVHVGDTELVILPGGFLIGPYRVRCGDEEISGGLNARLSASDGTVTLCPWHEATAVLVDTKSTP